MRILRAENLPINYKSRTANTSVTVSVLPSNLAKFTTAVVEGTINPHYDQEFSFCLGRGELGGKVVRLVVTDHEKAGTNVIGVAVVGLDQVGLVHDTETLTVREVWLSVMERNSETLKELLADR